MIEQDFVEINQIDGFLTFLWSIDWSDPWLIGLCIFHVSVTLSLFLMRNHSGFQAILFFVLLLLVHFVSGICLGIYINIQSDTKPKMIEQDFVEINQIDWFLTFLWSIDWSDPWLIGLCIFHVSVTLSLFLMRNHSGFQAILFFVLLLLVYFSESINELASTNWKIFSKQQYFDSRGLFISIVFSIPILLNCMVLVGSWLYYSYVMMSTLKTAQLRDSIRREQARKAGKQE